MRCEIKEVFRPVGQLDVVREGEVVPGLAEWQALQAWRESWRPEPDPARSMDELGGIFRRALLLGYAAYGAGLQAPPDLFSRDCYLTQMWEEGFAIARTDVELGLICQPAVIR